MSQYADIIERLEKATGPDGDLDLDIINLIDPPVARHSAMHQPYTASLDAAISLVDRMLPGWHWSLYDTDGLGRRNAQIEPPEYSSEPFDGLGQTIAIALLLALFRALEVEAKP